jgi:hypothetical protein
MGICAGVLPSHSARVARESPEGSLTLTSHHRAWHQLPEHKDRGNANLDIMRRVLFVGAGVSATFGMPVTARILPRAVSRLESSGGPGLFFGPCGRGPDEIEEEQFFAESLLALYPGIMLQGTEDDLAGVLPDVTDVLSFLDLLVATDQPIKPRWTKDGMARLRVVFDRAICEVLSTRRSARDSDSISCDGDGARLNATDFGSDQSETWTRLGTYLRSKTRSPTDHLTIITTNYDLLMDAAAREVVGEYTEDSASIDLGFEFRNVGSGKLIARPPRRLPEPRLNGRLALFKLHGSLNYLRCEVCDQVYVNPNGNIAHLAFERQPRPENTCHCGHGPLRHVIVAPSTVRTYRIPQVLAIWAAATEAMRTAREWIFAGYSLPSEDLAIRSLLFRAWHARGLWRDETKPIDEWRFQPKPAITVVQKGKGARQAYELLFGSGIHYMGNGLDKWLSKF